MPGKVNPVMCESMMQVAARVMGNDGVIAFSGATGGQFQLNIMMPVMGQTTLESISLLTGVTNAFVEFCSDDMEANTEACEAADLDACAGGGANATACAAAGACVFAPLANSTTTAGTAPSCVERKVVQWSGVITSSQKPEVTPHRRQSVRSGSRFIGLKNERW